MTRGLRVIRSRLSHPRLICRSRKPSFHRSRNRKDERENPGANRSAGFARVTIPRTSMTSPSVWSPAKNVVAVVRCPSCLSRHITSILLRSSKLYESCHGYRRRAILSLEVHRMQDLRDLPRKGGRCKRLCPVHPLWFMCH